MTIIDSNPGTNPARAELDEKRQQRQANAAQKKAFEAWKIQQIDKGVSENLDLAEFKRQQDLGLVPATPKTPEEIYVERGYDGAGQPPAPGNDVEEVKVEGLDGATPPAAEEPAPTEAPPAPAPSTEAPEVLTAARQFAVEKGAQVVHRAWSEGMRAQGREIKDELRLFPKLADQDLELDRAIATAVVESFVSFTNPPLLRAVQALLAGAQAYDGVDAHDPTKGRFLVDAATLHKLGQVLALPAGDGKERMTVQSIQQGGLVQALNDGLTQAARALDAAGGNGEVKVVGTITIKGSNGSWLREVKSVVEVKTGKLERTEFFTKAAGRDGALTLWDSASAQTDTKATQAEQKAKRKSAGDRKVKAGSEAAAQSA